MLISIFNTTPIFWTMIMSWIEQRRELHLVTWQIQTLKNKVCKTKSKSFEDESFTEMNEWIIYLAMKLDFKENYCSTEQDNKIHITDLWLKFIKIMKLYEMRIQTDTLTFHAGSGERIAPHTRRTMFAAWQRWLGSTWNQSNKRKR